MEIWIICAYPEAFPNSFMARKYFDNKPANDLIVSNSLKNLRAMMHKITEQELICLENTTHPKSEIIEAWGAYCPK